ncbi:hypothetical protein [Kitasatospora sp. NPDC018619]|uniref:hypothetical protein n=1 Tax=unclassified Kitasatospora TaxID=2633591 RepID=UPI00379DB0DF
MFKDGTRHRPGFAEVVRTWPPAIWVSARNVFDAPGARRVAAMTAGVEELTEGLLDGLAACATAWPTRCRSG